jgi:hypothetical protein
VFGKDYAPKNKVFEEKMFKIFTTALFLFTVTTVSSVSSASAQQRMFVNSAPQTPSASCEVSPDYLNLENISACESVMERLMTEKKLYQIKSKIIDLGIRLQLSELQDQDLISKLYLDIQDILKRLAAPGNEAEKKLLLNVLENKVLWLQKILANELLQGKPMMPPSVTK